MAPTPTTLPLVRPDVVARVRRALAEGRRPAALDVADAILRFHRDAPFLAIAARS